VFNRSNVSLVDLRETPIIKVTESGIETADGVREVDIIVWATGFDAITGALTKMEIVGPRGRTLKEYWSDGPRTYLGIQSSGFPNLLFAGGPHGILGNVPRTTEVVVDFIAGLLSYVREHGYKRIDTAESAEVAWTNHVYEGAAGRLLAAETSWIYGSNIPGKAKRFLLYGGGLQVYRKKLADVASNSYAGFVLSEKI
jgi:cation diffusion facilitator CzcD-associated flavoprotein CzcO